LILHPNDNVELGIDPGHGGADNGGNYEDYKEKNITLEIAKILESLCIHNGTNYMTTRIGDETVDLYDRTQMARNSKCDVFVSIHSDFFANSQANGSTVFYLGEDEEGAHPQGKELAESVNDSFEGLNIDRRGLRRAENEMDNDLIPSYCITRDAGDERPTILVETGFLSNEGDRRILTSHCGVYDIAYCLYEGITNFLEGYSNGRKE